MKNVNSMIYSALSALNFTVHPTYVDSKLKKIKIHKSGVGNRT